ncbi:MAG: type IV pilus modification protein PilV [Xanthomonadales bacterium]|nr:type IV pilus modification protein PilV [Xanthomonadales bacterium]
MSKRHHMSQSDSQRGYTLVEVMITVLILSIGLAALGLLQVLTIQNTYNSNNRALAVMSAEAMADRVRANVLGYELGAYTDIQTPITGGPECTAASPCDPIAIAQTEFTNWNDELAQNLPQGMGIMCMDGNDGDINDGEPGAPACGGGVNVIKVFWRESSASGSGTGDEVQNVWRVFGTPFFP